MILSWGRLVHRQLLHDLSLPRDEHAVRDAEDFREVRRDHDHGDAFRRKTHE